ncbi:FmdB family zinc ribbon protein [Dethiosulfatarculus sandiegensis]|uniref:Regulatory protein n=1 Tax=Dethiosulfatarculus sandiegensis TaxID=1429043 RepID=A0A0D2IZH9_9BACT|nr:zinc ribbon domain-containing protein [Dethiosulfatarculus sandiegensis]KIX11424.1 regulatory protein [Dethiosulfatarculus sandiegensis]
MPIYEYHCSDCGKDFEILVFKSDEKVTCPECKSEKVERLLSGFAHKCDGPMVSSSGGGCSSCSGGSCSSCH